MKILAVLIIALAFTYPVAAQPICDDRKTILESLRAGYDEQVVAIGLTISGSIVERLESPAGTWTLLVTTPAGISCFVAAGTDWTKVPRKLLGLRM